MNNNVPTVKNGLLCRINEKIVVIRKTDCLKTVKNIMLKFGYDAIEFNEVYIKCKDFSFIKDFYFVKKIAFVGDSVKDITPIKSLNKLEYLRIDSPLKGKVNFANFPELTSCYIDWRIKGSDSIFQSKKLKSLGIYNFTKTESFEISRFREQLKELFLLNAKIINLNGINNLNGLSTLNLSGCKNLNDLNGVENLSNLTELRLDSCKNIENISNLFQLNSLKILSFNNVGKINSISGLIELKKLEEIYFSGNTYIVDGDLNSLRILFKKYNLVKIFFLPRKHYSQKPMELGYTTPDIVANIFKKR